MLFGELTEVNSPSNNPLIIDYMSLKVNIIVSVFALSLMFTTSCKKNPESFSDLFDEGVSLRHKVVPIKGKHVYHQVFALFYHNNCIVALDGDNSTALSLTDLGTNTIVSRFGVYGQGPNELLYPPRNPVVLQKNIIRYYVNNNKCFFDVDISDKSKPTIVSDKLKFQQGFIELLYLKKGYSLAISYTSDGVYSLINNKGDELASFFDYPSFEGDVNFTKGHKVMAFQGNLSRHPNGEKVCFAGSTAELIDILYFDETKQTLTKVYEWQGNLGQYVPEGDGVNTISAAIKRESKKSFLSIATTGKYIYLLYSGRVIGDDIFRAVRGNTVFVIDWVGKPIKRYNLDVDVNCITVSDNDKILYGMAELDDTRLVKFALKH